MSTVPPSVSLRAGPLSPTSPPLETSKPDHQHRPLPQPNHSTPQTPTSPPLMSVSAQNYASSFTSQSSPGQTTAQSAPLSSPPSSAPMSTQVSQQPTLATTNSFPTPTSSVSGQHSNALSIDDAEGVEKSAHLPRSELERPIASNGNTRPDSMDIEHANYTRTDHDRHSGESKADATTNTASNAMDLDQGTTNPPDGGDFSLESLQRDMETAFHLCKTCKVSLRRDPDAF